MNDSNIELAQKIAQAVSEHGGVAYYIGGFVRDRLRKKFFVYKKVGIFDFSKMSTFLLWLPCWTRTNDNNSSVA